ncbi:MAG: chromate resistance protein [Desulfobacula sp.]|uniref:chromate resistance protein ChrB domain-containing protein n=1 Tax=Desulfobacula sp. TaxID=2593537 RepID=UPI0025BAD86D|nr:chromate resistance protein ChrB domain-containing protein [Desulfobacula sp.]MCD4722377.1 chromate resistance protein [Desulfobacula sp.]
MKRVLSLSIVIILIITQSVMAQSPKKQTVYSTWENMEIDKCASAWLLKQFVDKQAVFRFFAKGALISDGIPFDVPQADIRRYHTLSSFEYIMKKHKITDPALKQIAKIIHDIEINFWGEKKIKNSEEIYSIFQKIMETSKTPEECFMSSFKYFNELYGEFNE